MDKREKYIQRTNEIFRDNEKVKNIFINQINLFYDINEKYIKPQSIYKIGDMVQLKKGTFLHGAKHVTN